MKIPKGLARIIAVITALSISFLILEISYRAWCYIKYFKARNNRSVVIPLGYKDRMEYMLRPHLDYVSADGIKYESNSMGLRAKELEPKSGYRILALGDSFTLGQGEEAAYSYPVQLERLIKTEVINAGVSGYNTEQEYEFLKRYGLKYAPDLVMLGFYPNDAEPQNAITRSPYLEMEGVNIWIWELIKYRLNLLFKKDLFVLKKRERRLHEWDAFLSDDYKWKRDGCFESMKKMRDLLAGQNIAFLVVIISYPTTDLSGASIPRSI